MRLSNLRNFCALLGAVTLSGCSLIYDLSPDQCGNDSDCESFGENYRCIEGICQGNTKGECEQAADCPTFATEPTACIEKERGNPGSTACEVLRSVECPLILPTGGPNLELWKEALASADPIIVGGFAKIDPDGISTFSANYDLAFTEFQDKRGGVPGPNGSFRPIVAVICDNQGDAEQLNAGMDHLVEDLNVPGVIAALRSDQLLPLFSDVRSSEKNVYFMSPVEADSTLSNLDDEDLVWTLLPSTDQLALPYKPLLERTIAYLVAHRAVAEGQPIKVSMVHAPDLPGMEELTSAVEDLLVFNEKSFAENLTEENAQKVRVTSFAADPDADLSAQVAEILDFAPHIVLALGYDEIFSHVIPPIETDWEENAPAGQMRPFYLLSPYHVNTPSFTQAYLNGILALTGGDAFELRTAGVNYASAPEEYQEILTSYQQRLGALFPEDAKVGFENFYDAPWWLIYSIAAGVGTNTRFDGLDLVDGMDRLQQGTPYAMGPDDVENAMSDLLRNANASIQLNGTLGAPSFDNTGTRRSPGTVWCISANAMYILDAMHVDESGDEPVLVNDNFGVCNPDF